VTGERIEGRVRDWTRLIRDVPDFPEPGILFKDISPLLADPGAFGEIVDLLAAAGRDAEGDAVVDKVAGIEARGFLLASPVAMALGAGLVLVRKAGKLPRTTYSESYALEYGEATLQIHADSITADDRVMIVDDVLATGGTIAAATRLVERSGAKVSGVAVLIELAALHGRERLSSLPLTSLTVA
jgi:adenine phosphoribosyltransferase